MDPTTFTLARLLRRLAASQPDRPALTMSPQTSTFAELDRRSSAVAGHLRAAGIGAGDRIAVIARNNIGYFEVLFAAAKLRAVVVGVNFRLGASEVAAIVADSGASVVFAGAEQAPLVPVGPVLIDFDTDYLSWRDAPLDGGPDRQLRDEASPDDVVLQLYSSGTTGLPKGAMLTHANLSWTPRMGAEHYRMDASSVNLLTSPLFHVGGVGYGLTTLGQGGHSVLVADMDPATVLAAIGTNRVTHAFLVPTVIRLLLDALPSHPTDLSSLEMIAYGAAPIDDRTLLEAIGAFGSRFLGVYGMTETAGSVTALQPEDHDPGGPRAPLLRSVGRALPWHDVRVFDPDTGVAAPPGTVGEVWVRSPQNMRGYWGLEELTATTMRADGWLRTGDAAWADEEGYLFIHDRLKDMIISGGENVYPAEVERVLEAHPAVREVTVVGVPDAGWGETVKAVVVAAPGAAIDAASLIAFARGRLAHFKCPTSVDFVDELPRNAAGKVLKRTLRQSYRDRSAAASSP